MRSVLGAPILTRSARYSRRRTITGGSAWIPANNLRMEESLVTKATILTSPPQYEHSRGSISYTLRSRRAQLMLRRRVLFPVLAVVSATCDVSPEWGARRRLPRAAFEYNPQYLTSCCEGSGMCWVRRAMKSRTSQRLDTRLAHMELTQAY